MKSAKPLNLHFLQIIWGALKDDSERACLLFGLTREIGELIKGLDFDGIVALSNSHPDIPLFELRYKDSAPFWNNAVEVANKPADNGWGNVVKHHAMLMVSHPGNDEFQPPRRPGMGSLHGASA